MESLKGCKSMARGFVGGGGVGFHFLDLVVVPKARFCCYWVVLVFACNGYGNWQFFEWMVQINVEDIGLKMKCMT